jgi:hypothetical protein
MILHSKLNSLYWTSTCPSPSHIVSRRQDSHLLFSDAWFIVAKSLLILLQLTILSHTSLHIFNRLILEKLLLMIKLLPYISILRSSTWSILYWSRWSHKSWTKLIFNLFLFTWVSCLTWHRFFNVELFIGWLCMLIL